MVWLAANTVPINVLRFKQESEPVGVIDCCMGAAGVGLNVWISLANCGFSQHTPVDSAVLMVESIIFVRSWWGVGLVLAHAVL